MSENKMMNELSMEELEKIGGGLIVEDPVKKEFWLVRQDGSVIAPVPEGKAVEFAKAFNISTDRIPIEDYAKRFGRPFQW